MGGYRPSGAEGFQVLYGQGQPGVQIVACHRRAVQWLLHSAGCTLPVETVVHNMRASTPEAILTALADSGSKPSESAP